MVQKGARARGVATGAFARTGLLIETKSLPTTFAPPRKPSDRHVRWKGLNPTSEAVGTGRQDAVLRR